MYQWRQNVDRFVQIPTPLITYTKNCGYIFILSDVNTQKSNPYAQMDDADECVDSFALEKLPSVDKRENCQISSL